MAIELQHRFSQSNLPELAVTAPEAWAKESFEIATKMAYQNGALRGTPTGQRKDCREVTDAAVLLVGLLCHSSQKHCGSTDDAIGVSAGKPSGASY
jgi:hypothetical protein